MSPLPIGSIQEVKQRLARRLRRRKEVCALGIEKANSAGYVLLVVLSSPTKGKVWPQSFEGVPIRYRIRS